MNQDKTFVAYDDNGNEVTCEIIMTYECETNHKTYLFYTDNIEDEEGNINIYASIYLGEKEGELNLKEITDEEEWKLLDKVIEEKRGKE